MTTGEASTSELALVEALDYEGRPGYQPDFLTSGPAVSVPLVRDAARQKDVVQLPDGTQQLSYWTYTVVMSRSRRLPILSAANFDRATKLVGLKRPRAWRIDPRLAEDATSAAAMQIGDAWYSAQPSGTDRLFDRGHMTAFENAVWGDDAGAKGLDTFHFTNCAPQAVAFNENKIWRQIEVWAADKGDDGRVLLFNGPVFDAPRSNPLDDGEFELAPDGLLSPDPVLRGVAIPKQFFKVAAYVSDGVPCVQSFVVTQEDFLQQDGLGIAPPSERQLRLYRVPLDAVSHLTGLDFGPLHAAAQRENPLVPRDVQRITSLADLDLPW